MPRLIYMSITSLDGYIADEDGNFDWAEPDEEVHQFVNDHERAIGTYLYGRRLYETMAVWQDDEWMAGEPAVVHDYADIWRAADKVVFSTSLEAVTTPRTRLERRFDPALVRRLVADAPSDVSIGGATLAAHAVTAGLLDEYQVLINPVIVGGGTPWLPTGSRVGLELAEERRFGNGVVFARYLVRR
jgi:dihydrofolate reductase